MRPPSDSASSQSALAAEPSIDNAIMFRVKLEEAQRQHAVEHAPGRVVASLQTALEPGQNAP
jgi:hypothetical protein